MDQGMADGSARNWGLLVDVDWSAIVSGCPKNGKRAPDGVFHSNSAGHNPRKVQVSG